MTVFMKDAAVHTEPVTDLYKKAESRLKICTQSCSTTSKAQVNTGDRTILHKTYTHSRLPPAARWSHRPRSESAAHRRPRPPSRRTARGPRVLGDTESLYSIN